MSDGCVTLDEVFTAAALRRASLVPETSGYLALAIGDATSRMSFAVEDRAVLLTTEGTVTVPRRGEAVPPARAAEVLRDVLARLLAASTGTMPGLASAARPRAESDRGVEAVVQEIEAALIPVNRAAARRALARLARETLKAKEAGKLKIRTPPPAPKPAEPAPVAAPAPVAVSAPVPAPVPAPAPAPAPVAAPAPAPVAVPVPVPVPVPAPAPTPAPIVFELAVPPAPVVFELDDARPLRPITLPPPVFAPEPSPDPVTVAPPVREGTPDPSATPLYVAPRSHETPSIQVETKEPTPTVLGMAEVDVDGRTPAPARDGVTEIDVLTSYRHDPALPLSLETIQRVQSAPPRPPLTPPFATSTAPGGPTRADDLLTRFGTPRDEDANMREAAACLKKLAGFDPTPPPPRTALPKPPPPPLRRTDPGTVVWETSPPPARCAARRVARRRASASRSRCCCSAWPRAARWCATTPRCSRWWAPAPPPPPAARRPRPRPRPRLRRPTLHLRSASRRPLARPRGRSRSRPGSTASAGPGRSAETAGARADG